MDSQKIIVLDFGGQYSKLIARRVRDAGVYCEVYPCDGWNGTFDADVKGVILSGGPDSVYADEAPRTNPALFDCRIPLIGICYGMQYISHRLGGSVRSSPVGEFGKTQLHILHDMPLLHGIPADSTVWMSHSDSVSAPPKNFTVYARTQDCPIAVMADTAAHIYGLQFHPEVTHTDFGTQILENFLFTVCGCKKNWHAPDMIPALIENIRRQAKDKKVISALSGGVDSSVASVLVHRAVADNLTCIFVDHGLLRKNEARSVLETYRNNLGLNIVHVDASQRFLKRLSGITDPEQKRKIIGEEFIRVFEEEAQKIGGAECLVQGTIYPDIIESGGSKHAAVIKSHHNVGGLPKNMAFTTLIEPLRDFFKDEVRTIGLSLGIPAPLIWRQPFPGPGLAVRILGEITREKLRMVRESDAILHEEISRAGLERSIWQYFTVFPNIRSVGAAGDGRTYENAIVIRAVTSIDAMSADTAEIPYSVLLPLSARITNEVAGINRVVYDITGKPPGTIEWE